MTKYVHDTFLINLFIFYYSFTEENPLASHPNGKETFTSNISFLSRTRFSISTYYSIFRIKIIWEYWCVISCKIRGIFYPYEQQQSAGNHEKHVIIFFLSRFSFLLFSFLYSIGKMAFNIILFVHDNISALNLIRYLKILF